MKGKQLFSLIQADGTFILYLDEVDTGPPGPDDLIIQIGASPINPSDLALLLGATDLATLQGTRYGDLPAVEATIPASRLPEFAGRVGVPMAVGNEGAGLVVAAGKYQQAFIGKTVACIGRAMYAEYIRVPASLCHILPDDATAAEGAASLVNPMTVLAMLETMRAEGHGALVHTAAASSLGQMLNRVCIADDIPLINIVRRQEQADLLFGQGARHVCVSEEPDFLVTLAQALDETRATIAFDAIGGGPMVGDLLSCMEAVALRHAPHYSRYGSMVRKTVHVYGRLDDRPIEFTRGFDFSWTVSAWLLPLTQARMTELWGRVSRELKTSFATQFGGSLSLDEMIIPSNIMQYAQKATGLKFLVRPSGSRPQ